MEGSAGPAWRLKSASSLTNSPLRARIDNQLVRISHAERPRREGYRGLAGCRAMAGGSLFGGRDYRRVRARFRPLARRGWSSNEEDRKMLAASDRATVQARLERAFVEFER
jgi:hypothetical protein